MERYNQGFKYFGPMEQCKNGRWVKYKDHLSEIEELKKLIVEFDKQLERNYKKKVSEMELVTERWVFIAAASLAANAGFILSEIINRFFL